MPITFPAHQAPVLPLKLWRPQWFDATALCLGSAAPDLAYPLGQWVHGQSHTAIGIVVWAVPFTLVASAVLRWRGAAGVFAHLPDLGPFRLRSYRVIARRRPPPVLTLVSAVIGAVSHVFIDGFTHTGRWGANWLGLNVVVADVPFRGEVTAAVALQAVGHVGGSLLGLALLLRIGRRRLLERWYGPELVEADRAVSVTPIQRLVFWSVALLPPLVAGAWSIAEHRNPIFVVLAPAAVGLIGAGTLPLYRAASPLVSVDAHLGRALR